MGAMMSRMLHVSYVQSSRKTRREDEIMSKCDSRRPVRLDDCAWPFWSSSQAVPWPIGHPSSIATFVNIPVVPLSSQKLHNLFHASKGSAVSAATAAVNNVHFSDPDGGRDPHQGLYTLEGTACRDIMYSHDGTQVTEALKPTSMEIFNDSHKHAHHKAMKGSTSQETHFR